MGFFFSVANLMIKAYLFDSMRKSSLRFRQCILCFSLCASSMGKFSKALGHNDRALSNVSSKCGLIVRHGIHDLLAQI